MKTTVICEVELPTIEELYKELLNMASMPLKDTDKSVKLIEAISTNFIKAVQNFNEAEWREDPEYTIDILTNLHQYNCAIIGFLTTLFRKIKSGNYVDLLVQESEGAEAGEKTKKLTEAAKDHISRVAGAGLEGMIEMFEGLQYNFNEKLNAEQNKAKRRL